jgi:hypothetical protein
MLCCNALLVTWRSSCPCPCQSRTCTTPGELEMSESPAGGHHDGCGCHNRPSPCDGNVRPSMVAAKTDCSAALPPALFSSAGRVAPAV